MFILFKASDAKSTGAVVIISIIFRAIIKTHLTRSRPFQSKNYDERSIFGVKNTLILKKKLAESQTKWVLQQPQWDVKPWKNTHTFILTSRRFRVIHRNQLSLKPVKWYRVITKSNTSFFSFCRTLAARFYREYQVIIWMCDDQAHNFITLLRRSLLNDLAFIFNAIWGIAHHCDCVLTAYCLKFNLTRISALFFCLS